MSQPPDDRDRGPWAEYVDAARRLDAVRRAMAATVAEETAAAQAAREELRAVRSRLAAQQSALANAASGAGLTPPIVAPHEAEVELAAAQMRPTPGGVPAAALASLRSARSLMDSADVELTGVRDSAGLLTRLRAWPPPIRNLLVYGPLAALVLLVQLGLFVAATESPSALSVLCGLTLPVVAFVVGWLAVGMLYPSNGPGKVDRTPAVGAVVCLAPLLLACVGFGTLAILR